MSVSREQLRIVERAAWAGASSVSRSRQLADDAVARTIEQWERLVIAGRSVRSLEGWAFRVSANAAKRMGGRSAAEVAPLPDHGGASLPAEPPELGVALGATRSLRDAIEGSRSILRGRQFEVLLKLSEAGMNFHRAAAELKMDRANVRRAFRSGLRRIRSQA